jgi:peptidoglycan hydrolase-like protein with peptidoglycan-binding domain
VRFYGPWLPPVPLYGGWPYYGYYGPPVGVSVGAEPGPTYRGARVDDRGDDLSLDVQRALRRDGYYHGEVDGDVGAGTRGAIRQYQYDHRLEVTGRIDRALLHSLGLD